MGSALDRAPARGPAIGFGVLNLASAGLLTIGVFGGLPDRYWPVDSAAAALIGLLLASGIGLVLRTSWCARCAKVTAAASLAVGLVLIGALAISASYLAGIYGPIGRGGAIIFVLVLALAVPYLVAIPVAELVWLGRAARSTSTRSAGSR
jgi:hypothetical protein